MSEGSTRTDRAGGGDAQAIYRRFRAQTFEQIVGQDAAVRTLRNAVRLGRVGHAYLFVGPRGTGKTSTARILAKAVNCLELHDGEPDDTCQNCVAIREGRALDVIELDAASNNKVDDMRELVPRVHTAAADLRRKVFIIDEVQRIKDGWDVLLKTLEEPPDGVLFIFCTTDPSQIRPAVVSRLQRFTFRPLAQSEIGGKLERILAAEGRSVEPAALALVARSAGGGMRDAESMLDQILNSADDPITEGSVRDLLGLADDDAVASFMEALVAGDAAAGISVLDAQEAEGRDLVAFAEQVVMRLRADLVAAVAGSGVDPGRAAAVTQAARRLTGIDASRSGLGGYRWQLELALLEAAATRGSQTASGASVTPSSATPATAAPATVPVVADPPTAPARTPAPTTDPTPGVPEAATDPAASSGAAAAPDRERISAPPPETGPDGAAAPGADDTAPSTPASPEGAVATSGLPVDVPPATDPAAPGAAGAPAVDAPVVAAALVTSDPASPSPAEGDGGGADGIEEIRAAWPRIVEAVAANPANRPLISACRPVEMREGALVLGFPEDQAFLRDIAERKRTILEDGIASAIGRSLAVRCVVTNLELVEPVDAGEGDLVSHARRIFEGDLVDVADVD